MGRGSRAEHRAPLPLRRAAPISGTLQPRGQGSRLESDRSQDRLSRLGPAIGRPRQSRRSPDRIGWFFRERAEGALRPVPQLQVPQDLFGDKRSFRGNKALGDQTVEMGMKPGGIVTIALQRGDHAGDGAAIAGGLLEEFLDGGIKAPAQQAEEPAVVLEAEAQHFGYGHDLLADREVSQNLFVDALGKEQSAFLMA